MDARPTESKLEGFLYGCVVGLKDRAELSLATAVGDGVYTAFVTAQTPIHALASTLLRHARDRGAVTGERNFSVLFSQDRVVTRAHSFTLDGVLSKKAVEVGASELDDSLAQMQAAMQQMMTATFAEKNAQDELALRARFAMEGAHLLRGSQSSVLSVEKTGALVRLAWDFSDRMMEEYEKRKPRKAVSE